MGSYVWRESTPDRSEVHVIVYLVDDIFACYLFYCSPAYIYLSCRLVKLVFCANFVPICSHMQCRYVIFKTKLMSYLELELTAPAGPGTPLWTQRGPATLELLYRSVALAVTDGFSSSLAVSLSLSAPSTAGLT